MKSRHLLLLLPVAALAGVIFAQGPLTPPGAPAPVMKTLDQIEPRTPIASLPFMINQSGSYYLTRNFQAAAGAVPISIQANNVTLDLNGFTLSSTPEPTGPAIQIGTEQVAYRHIRITNGMIKGTTTVTITGNFPNRSWSAAPGGFNTAIDVGPSISCEFSHLTITGCRATGLIMGRRTRVHHVTVEENGLGGIRALDSYARCDVQNCIAGRNIGVGISAGGSIITSCGAEDNSGGGIVGNNSCVSNCVATDNGGTGIDANNGSAHHCVAQSNSGYGIAGPGGSVAFCNTNGNSMAGIFGASITRTGNYPAP